jgi:phage portal protein BeeE
MNFIDKSFSNLINKRGPGTATSVMGHNSGLFSMLGWGGASGSKPLPVVTVKRALTVSAVWDACNNISNSVGVVPFGVYQTVDTGNERQKDHPADWLLTQEPDGENGWLTPFQFKKVALMSLLLRGNSLWEKIYKPDGAVKLKYIAWDDVTDIKVYKWDDGETSLVYMLKNGNYLFTEETVHLRGLSLDGVVGLSVISYACLTMNLAISIAEFSYTNFENKGVRQGVIETEKSLAGQNGAQRQFTPGVPQSPVPTAEDLAAGRKATPNSEGTKLKIIAGWRAAMQEKNADRVIVLDEGMTFKPIMLSPQEAQIIEQGKFTNEDFSRWFNIAPHKIKNLERSTNNNIEHQALEYSTDTIQPWVTNLEQEFAKKLLTREDRKAGYFVKGNMNVLLRANMESRSAFFTRMVNSGIMTPNEARRLEDMNDKEGGDDLRFPVNTQTQEQIENSLKNG